jgi:hypothetical protein
MKTILSTMIRPCGDDPDHDHEEEKNSAELNAPHLDDSGEVTNKAVEDEKQAWGIAKALKKAAMEAGGRLSIAGTVASLYNSATPFIQKKLDDAGQRWRANFSTGFMPSIVDRITPQLRDPIYRVETLTHANLCTSYSTDSANKSRKFREITTKTVRAWKGWNDFVSLLAQDVVLHGSATPGRVNRDWRPRLFRTDQCYLFEKSDQHATRLQAVVFWEPVMIHDFLDDIRDKEAAKLAGYDIQGCIKAINHTTTKSNTSERTTIEEQDTIREKGTLQDAAENQGRILNLFHLFVREYDGKLALWTISEEGGHLVRKIEDCEDAMDMEGIDDATTLFTLQVGNGKFYGSKGLGRMLANVHIAVERGRCLAIDQNYLSGLPILQVKDVENNTLNIVVQHPFILVKGNAEIAKTTVSFKASDWKQLDDMLTTLAEGIAGAFIPPNLNTGGAANTKIEAAQKAEREVAVRQGVLGRFFSQFSDLVGMMKRALYSPENLKEGYRIFKENEEKKHKKGIKVIASKLWKMLKKVMGEAPERTEEDKGSAMADQEAVAAIVELLSGENALTMEEIIELRNAPDGNDVQGSNAERDEKTMEWIAANAQNPFMNKRKATELSARIAAGEDRSKDLINKAEHDPNDVAIATRAQISEFNDMMAGDPIGVAVTDLHAVHRDVLEQKIGELVSIIQKSIQQNLPLEPKLVLTAQMANDHFNQHIMMDLDSEDQVKIDDTRLSQTWAGIIQAGIKLVDQQIKEREMEAEAVAQAEAAAGHPPSPEVQLKAEELALKSRDLDIKERKQGHDEKMDILTFTKDVATEKAEAGLRGVADADAQIQSDKDRDEAAKQLEAAQKEKEKTLA